jgi:hypothetical protein
MKGRTSLTVLLTCAALAGATEPGAARPHEVGAQAQPAAGAAPRLVTRNVHWHRTSIGSLLVFGEVTNRGPGDAANIGVLVELYDARAQRLARGATLRTSVNVLGRGATAVWLAQMSDNPRTWKRMKITAVEQIGADAARQQNYTGFRVKGVRLAPENPGFSQRVTGTVVNVGGKTSKVAAVVLALYDARRRLVWVADQGFLYPYATSRIVPPRKSAPFRASVLGYTKQPARMVTYVRASTKGANGLYLS